MTGDVDEDQWDRVFTIRTKDGRGPFLIRIAPGTRERLERLADVFDVVWATTWMDGAATLLAPELGLGSDWPHVPMAREISLARAGAAPTDTWKLPAIQRWAAETDRPLAWIDDDIGEDAVEWAEHRTRAVAPTVLALTNPFVGLTEAHAEALLGWERQFATNPGGPGGRSPGGSGRTGS